MDRSINRIEDEPLRRVFLVDDHPILLDGLIRLVRAIPRCMVCGQATSAAEALARIPAANPDLVIMDISLPDRSGLELTKELHAIIPEASVLALSMHDEMLYAARIIKAGGKGYLMKGVDTSLLIEAINRVLDGGIYLSQRMSDHLLGSLSGSAPQNRLQVLSDRELEIFGLIGNCQSVSQISQQLKISPKTVDTHRASIREKLGLTDAASLMQEATLWVELSKEPQPKTAEEGNSF